MENQILEGTLDVLVGRDFPKVVTPLIDSAKHSIKIIVFDWRWYGSDPANPVQVFNQSLVRATRRGVKVRAICNAGLLVPDLVKLGIEARHLKAKGLVHAKLLIVDERHVVLGSHNYTQNAFTLNQEVSVLLSDCGKVGEFLRFFEALWLN